MLPTFVDGRHFGWGRVDSMKGMHIRNKNKQMKTPAVLNSTYKMI
jgi:hypothetical protein